MALEKCKECGNEISSSATICPKCGAKIKRTSALTKILAVFIILGAIGAFISSPDESPATPKTPQEIAAEQQKEVRFQKTFFFVSSLKEAMKNPDSFKIDEALSNSDGSVICVTYYAQNSFGGTIREYAVYASNRLSQDASVWNKNCANKQLFDVSYVRQALK